jgi:hypothetical protein
MDQKTIMIKRWLIAVVVVIAAAAFSACEKIAVQPIPFNPSTQWNFQADIQPIFTANCITCHNGSRSPDLRDGKSYSALSKGYVNLPGSSSRLYVKITSSDHIPRTSDNQKLMILNWIDQGAKKE